MNPRHRRIRRRARAERLRRYCSITETAYQVLGELVQRFMPGGRVYVHKHPDGERLHVCFTAPNRSHADLTFHRSVFNGSPQSDAKLYGLVLDLARMLRAGANALLGQP